MTHIADVWTAYSAAAVIFVGEWLGARRYWRRARQAVTQTGERSPTRHCVGQHHP